MSTPAKRTGRIVGHLGLERARRSHVCQPAADAVSVPSLSPPAAVGRRADPLRGARAGRGQQLFSSAALIVIR